VFIYLFLFVSFSFLLNFSQNIIIFFFGGEQQKKMEMENPSDYFSSFTCSVNRFCLIVANKLLNQQHQQVIYFSSLVHLLIGHK